MMLDGKVALITAAHRGIGAAMAIRLAEHGAKVAVHYFTDEARAKIVVDQITSNGGSAFAVQADVTERDAVARMVAHCTEQAGPVDILVNGARQISVQKPFLELEWSDYETQIDPIIKGAFNCSQAVLRPMMERKSGRIINMLSTAIFEPDWRRHTYALAKGALLHMTRNLAAEMGPYNVTVNALSPGHVTTERPSRNSQEHHQKALDLTPMGRFAEVADVADALILLCSDNARFITGANIPLCGGKWML